MNPTPPDHPAGPFQPVEDFDPAEKERLINIVREAPAQLRLALAGLSPSQLDTRYKNWTIRQISHHLADSHLHSIIRFKWALTENHPTIKAYEEADWVQLADCRTGDIEPALALLSGLHAKWVQILESMTEQQFGRTFHHPQSGASVSLWMALNNYAWHGQHHTAQIQWLRRKHGWVSQDVQPNDFHELATSQESISIIPMSVDHVPEVIALWQATTGLILTYSDNVSDLDRYFSENPQLSYVALREERIVGAVLCGHDGRRGYLHHLAVAEEYRGRGIGRMLTNACLRKLQADGILQCNLFVVDDNLAGKAFWERDGWSEWPNIRLMSKRLEER